MTLRQFDSTAVYIAEAANGAALGPLRSLVVRATLKGLSAFMQCGVYSVIDSRSQDLQRGTRQTATHGLRRDVAEIEANAGAPAVVDAALQAGDEEPGTPALVSRLNVGGN
jgi:hypothetical protein